MGIIFVFFLGLFLGGLLGSKFQRSKQAIVTFFKTLWSDMKKAVSSDSNS